MCCYKYWRKCGSFFCSLKKTINSLARLFKFVAGCVQNSLFSFRFIHASDTFSEKSVSILSGSPMLFVYFTFFDLFSRTNRPPKSGPPLSLSPVAPHLSGNTFCCTRQSFSPHFPTGLAVGMSGSGGQLCTSLIAPGSSEGLLAERLVTKLSKRTGAQVFLSLSLDEAAVMERFGEIEAAVMEELSVNPERFVCRV